MTTSYSDITRKVEALSLWHGVVPWNPSWRALALSVAEKHALRMSDLFGPSRLKKVNRARQEAMWLIRKQTAFSLPAIGRFFNRDHTTVLSGIRAHERRLQQDRLAA